MWTVIMHCLNTCQHLNTCPLTFGYSSSCIPCSALVLWPVVYFNQSLAAGHSKRQSKYDFFCFHAKKLKKGEKSKKFAEEFSKKMGINEKRFSDLMKVCLTNYVMDLQLMLQLYIVIVIDGIKPCLLNMWFIYSLISYQLYQNITRLITVIISLVIPYRITLC